MAKLVGKNTPDLAEIEKLVGFFPPVLDEKGNILCFFTRGLNIIAKVDMGTNFRTFIWCSRKRH